MPPIADTAGAGATTRIAANDEAYVTLDPPDHLVFDLGCDWDFHGLPPLDLQDNHALNMKANAAKDRALLRLQAGG